EPALRVHGDARAGVRAYRADQAAPDRVVPGEADLLRAPGPFGGRRLLLLDAVTLARGLRVGRRLRLGPRQRWEERENQRKRGPKHGWHSVSDLPLRQGASPHSRRDLTTPRRVT